MRPPQSDHDGHQLRRDGLNPILRRQLRRAGLQVDQPPGDLDGWVSFLATVSEAFDDAERSQRISERSLEISSEEMRELNERVRTAANTDLRRERDGLRATLDATNDGMCRLDREGRVVLANRVALALLGNSERELLETPIMDRFSFVVEGTRYAGEELLDAIEMRRTLRSLSGVVIRSDGHETPIECNLEPIQTTPDERNSVLSFRDLTDHRRVREALERSEAHYGSLVHRAPIAFMEEDFSAVGEWLNGLRRAEITDLGAWLDEHPLQLRYAASLIRILDANAAAVEMLGAASTADLLGPLDPTTITADTLTSIRDQVEGLWNDRDLTVTRVSGSRTDGERLEAILHWGAPRILGALDLRRVVVGMVDITDLTEAQERTQELIQSKDKFLAAISHELRTPLTAVNVSAALLDESAHDLDADRAEGTRRVHPPSKRRHGPDRRRPPRCCSGRHRSAVTPEGGDDRG